MSDLNFTYNPPVPEEPTAVPAQPAETQTAQNDFYASSPVQPPQVIQTAPAEETATVQEEDPVSSLSGSTAYPPAYSYSIPTPPQASAYTQSSYTPVPTTPATFATSETSEMKSGSYYASGTASPYQSYPGYPYSSYPGYSSQSSAPKKERKPKKEKHRYSIGQMFAVSICSALICGIISSAVVATQLPAVSGSSATGGSTVKTVNISGQADNLVSAVAEKAAPSVVGVRITTQTSNRFFGSSDAVGEGSGVIYSADGYIITNYHVVSAAVEYTSGFGGGSSNSVIEVYLPSDPETAQPATLIGYDVSADLAVLKIEKTGLMPIEIGDSEQLKVGDTAIAIGNPGGLEFMGSVSSGIISGLNRKLQTESGTEMNLIQTDAAINPGNSGGALVDQQGRLIGINNSKMAGNGFEGMGFAIPVNEVTEITKRLIKNENQPQSYLGVTIDSSYDAATLKQMGYPAGALVFSVAPGSPASQAGIQKYDIITKINDADIVSYTQLNSEKNKYAPGETITVTVFRENKSYDVQVTLAEMQSQMRTQSE